MEELLILILQGAIEFLFELFGYLPWDFWWYAQPIDSKKEGGDNFSFGWVLFFSVMVGMSLGYFSTFIFPNVIIKFAWLRIALLFISPVVSGCIARVMAKRREIKGYICDPDAHFWLSFCFSMGLVWIRFVYAHRV